jgi:hypothetical protein
VLRGSSRPTNNAALQDLTPYPIRDAGWLQVRKLRGLRVVFSRQGAARRLLGRVTDDPAVSAAGRIQAYALRWESDPSLKDCKQLLGLGHYQNRPYRAAVIHRPRVCCASACPTCVLRV